MATFAVFVALGGSSYAAVTLKKNSVKSRNIARNAVTSPKVKNRSLLATDFKLGQLPSGPRGPEGPQGSPGTPGTAGGQGPAGTALAYAHVLADGTLDTTRSKNVAGVQQYSPVPGLYCFRLNFAPQNVMATIANEAGVVRYFVEAGIGNAANCDTFTSGFHEAHVITFRADTSADANHGFWVMFN
jgi:hypothetical protein